MSTPAIKVENISKEYVIGGQQKNSETFRGMLAAAMKAPVEKLRTLRGDVEQEERFWALQGINFEVQPGEVVGVVGRNGAGKSTLLKILSRITEPTAGEIQVRGRIASLLEVGTGFHPELTGRENIFLNGAILGMSRREIEGKFDEIVAFSEVEKFLDTPVKRYSSGMHVRLAFSVAAHLDTDVLLVDEVLAVGDAAFQKKCLSRMETLGAGGRTVLFVSHNLGVVSSLCSRCVYLESGQLKLDGPTKEVIPAYMHFESSNDQGGVSERQRRHSSSNASIQCVELCDSTGQKISSILIGERFSIRMQGRTNAEFSGYFWVTLFDPEGRAVVSAHQGDREMLQFNQGAFSVTMRANDFSLYPGSYTIACGILSASRDILEWVDDCQVLEVLPSFADGRGFDGRLGFCGMDADWTDKSDNLFVKLENIPKPPTE